MTGTDAVVVVLEPSLTSLHDAGRVIELVRGFGIPVYAVINKSDINKEVSVQIEEYLEAHAVLLLGKIPFDRAFVEAMVDGKSIVEFNPDSESSGIIHSIWSRLLEEMESAPLKN